MPVKDEVWVIDDESILTVDQAKARGVSVSARGASPPARRSATTGSGPTVTVAVRGAPADPGSSRPFVAATLSMFVCGAGQAYNGQIKLGVLFFLLEILVAAFHWSATAMWGVLQEMGYIFEVSEEGMLLAVAALDVLLLALILESVAQAWRYASATTGEFRGFGRPIFSALASLVIPGWGQLLNAQLSKALAFFFIVFGGILATLAILFGPFAPYLDRINMIGLLRDQDVQFVAGAVFLGGALWVLSVYDALLIARYGSRAR